MSIKSFYHSVFPTYIHLLSREISTSKSLIEFGSGRSSPLKHIKFKGKSVGIDIDDESIKMSRKQKIHSDYIKGDVLKHKIKSKFDCALALDLIEHLKKKDGHKLIAKMLSVSDKKVIIFTPNGFLPQAEKYGNPYQKHLSGWTVEDFRKMGFKVYGVNGLKFLRKEEAKIRFYPKFFWTAVSEASQLIAYFFPKLAFQILAVKKK